jgi:MoaA/NifB/PqqE/SkfB family radical SAM enzyme
MNSKGEVNPRLTMSELSFDDFVKIFPPDFIKQLDKLNMCGNFGDPAAAKDTLEVFRYIRLHNPTMVLEMFTNGGLRHTEWWIELAHILGKNGRVIFSVDGLEDTNHIYRKNVNWGILRNNIVAFINAGGRAVWEFLIFAHNQHQLEEARALSKELGFISIVFKKSSRFHIDLNTVRTAIVKHKGVTTEITAPTQEYQNIVSTKQTPILQKYGSDNEFCNKTAISCKAITRSGIFISAEGLMMPCCWLGGAMYWNVKEENEIWKLIDQIGGKDKLDARNGLATVFNSGILELIQDSWNKSSVADGRLLTCIRTCSSEFDPIGSQYV